MPALGDAELHALGRCRDRSAANSIAARLARRLAGRALSLVCRSDQWLNAGRRSRTSAVARLTCSSCGRSGQPEPVAGALGLRGASPDSLFTRRNGAVQRLPQRRAALPQLARNFGRVLAVRVGSTEKSSGRRFVELPTAFKADEVFAFRHDLSQLLALGAVKRKDILFVHGWPSSVIRRVQVHRHPTEFYVVAELPAGRL